jgi:hypothetical protein
MELAGLEPATSWVRCGVLDTSAVSRGPRSHRKQGVEWALVGTKPACDPGAGGTSMPQGKRKPPLVQGLSEVELGGLEPPTS